MNIELILLAALSVSAIVGTISLIARDGYRRIPTNR